MTDKTENRLISDRSHWKNEQHFMTIYEQASVGIVVVDTECRFEKANKRYCEIIGYTEAELQQMMIEDITYKHDKTDLEEDMRQFHRLLTGELSVYKLEKRNVRKDGQVIWIHLSVSPLFGKKPGGDWGPWGGNGYYPAKT